MAPSHSGKTPVTPPVPRTVPLTMRAVAIDDAGGPEMLTVHQLPVPRIDDHEVLIAVDTAGVGSWDPAIRAGWWPEGRPRFPLVLGTDGAGTIVATGARVRRLKVRDKVYGYSWLSPKGGFYAEFAAVEASKAALIPAGLELREAGAMPATALTALQGIDNALRIKQGDTLIIHGASGGVGTLAVQFAKWRGARVFATASGTDGAELVRDLGADEAIDGRQGDITAAIRRFAPDGVDAVFALAGGEPLERCLDALRSDGRLAYPNGVEPEPLKRPGLRVVSYDAVADVGELELLNEAIEATRLRVVIAAEYPLGQAAKAHERLEAGHVLGKIVLRIR
jgi:NADPH2:quinone reductase